MNGQAEEQGYAFGTFKGVYTPSVLTILGVVMYLRLSWVLGSVGLPATLLVVTIATSITFLTGLSLSALATNMKIGGGGAYFIISRSLGLEAGAAIGLPLFFAQALGIAFYIAGFTEAVIGNLGPWLPVWMTGKVIAVTTLSLLTLLAYLSADLALKAQFFILATIILSLGSFFLGGEATAVPGDVLVPKGVGFWPVFAVFFPAVTGIEAGLAMSGDLKNPAKALPLGTLGAVVTGYLVYLAIPVLLSLRIPEAEMLLNPNALRAVAHWGVLIVAGVFAASLSSALGALLGAPRTLQALANDRIIPPFIGRGYGKDNADPRIATALSFGVALVAVLLGDLNLIAPVLTMFFLTSYGLLNLSAGLEGLIESPTWRPKFKIHCAVSLLGAAGCFITMLMINAGATIIAVFTASLVYYLVKRRRLVAHWGDMRYGILSLVARFAVGRLDQHKPDERTWRPNILALSGSPKSRWHLVEMAYALAQHRSALTVASILPVEDWSAEKVQATEEAMHEFLDKRNVEAMVKIFPFPDMLSGAKALVRTYGYGPLTPNTILIGDTENRSSFRDFSEFIQLVFQTKHNLIVLRDPEGKPPAAPEGAEKTEKADDPEESETIDVWWGGDTDNIGLMLTLAYQIQKSPVWHQSRLVIKTIVENEEKREGAEERFETFIKEQRIPAETEVMIQNGAGFFDMIRDSSAEAGLVFMGMRPPGADEPAGDYARYYGTLMETTRGLPPLALVLAAESIEFRKVIGLSELN
jgi:amino acid transporter